MRTSKTARRKRPKACVERVRGIVMLVQPGVGDHVVEWRAELWLNPYDGEMLACTKWYADRRSASRYGKRYLREAGL